MRSQAKPAQRSFARMLGAGTLLAVLVASLLLAGCTREQVAAAMATVAVDLQATLQPFGATVAARSSVPHAATPAVDEATVPPLPVVAEVTATLPTPNPSPTTASSTATPRPSPTPEPSPTITPSPSPTPSPTPVPSPTPLPVEIEQDGARMILVPGGYFAMGADAGDMLAECEAFRSGCEAAWFSASEPAHMVLLAPFYIDQREVTNLAFLEFLNDAEASASTCTDVPCLDTNQSQLDDANTGGYQIEPELVSHPVAGVTWAGAAAYCTWRGARLPTEAEWEKAALWDSESATGGVYPWGTAFDGTRVNFCDVNCDAPQANPDYNDGFAETAPVGSLPAGRSPAGADDMAGNVWEWVADWYSETYYAESAAANPQGPAAGSEKVVRGGSYFDTGNFTSGFIRFPSPPENADATIGFRCALSLP